jgi:TonB-linked SusC/RagA family outer membrane protein
MICHTFFHKKISLVAAAAVALSLQAVAQADLQKKSVDSAALQNSFFNRNIPVAFGPAQARKNLTASISTVGSAELKRINTPMVGNTLFGRLSGLLVTQSGSAPGNNDNPGLSIRGRQTFQDNNVMVLVDGFETNWSNLLVDEIETISVLKDAAALAQYGQEGANGVILITTKRGKATAKTNINFTSRFGVQSATVLPKVLGSGDYAEMYNIAMGYDGKQVSNGLFKDPSVVDYYRTGQYPYLYPNVDWYNEALKPNTSSQDYALTFNGGREDAKYFVALGYANYNGLYANTDKKASLNSNYNLKRYNVRANFDVNINKYLSSELRFRGTMMDKRFPNANEATLFRTMALFNPYPVRTAEGTWGGTQGYNENPVAAILGKGYQTINDRTLDANVKVIGKLDFLAPGWKIFGQVNFNNFYYDTYNKTRGYAYDELTPRPDLATPTNLMPFDRTTRGATDKNFVISQTSGNQYNRTTLVAGTEYEHNYGKHGVYASVNYLQEVYRGNGSEMPFAKQNIMGRINYNYNQKYLAEFGYSYMGSEGFPKGNRFGFFPSISAGWVLNKESFLAESKAINLLKLRGSVGLLGNNLSGNSGRFIFNQYYTGAGSYFLGNNLAVTANMYGQGNLANPSVTWEKALRANIGVDAILFNKLTIAADYFTENRTDIFVPASNILPAVMGASAYNLNRGETKNSGGELELEWKDKVGAVQYYINGNISYAKNKIIDIQEPPRPYDYLKAAGNAINQPFVLEAVGFFSTQAEINASPKQLFGDVRIGDIKYKDQNGDGFIDDNDRKPIGNTSYPSTYFGAGAGFSYSGFDMNVFFNGSMHRTVSLLDNSNIIPFLNGGVRPTQWVKENYWTPERGNAALFPRLTTESNSNNYRASTLWQRNGSFVRLRSIELGYTLPANLLQRFHMTNVRLFVSGNNLVTWHKITEMEVDPEVMNMFIHPPLKSYNFGLTLGL